MDYTLPTPYVPAAAGFDRGLTKPNDLRYPLPVNLSPEEIRELVRDIIG